MKKYEDSILIICILSAYAIPTIILLTVTLVLFCIKGL